MTSTVSKRQHVWVCWQEPEMDRGKFSMIPCSWIAKSLQGDGQSPGSVVLCRWPRSEELFTAKVIHDPTPNDLAQVEVMDVPMFMEEGGGAESGNEANNNGTSGGRKSMIRSSTRPTSNQQGAGKSSNYGGAAGNNNGTTNNGNEDGSFIVSQLKRFFLGEMSKLTAEMQANFDILGHRVGALEVNTKCVRERVERIENILNTAAHDFDTERNQSSGFVMQQPSDTDDNDMSSLGRGGGKVKSESASALSFNKPGSMANNNSKQRPSAASAAIDLEEEEMQDDNNGLLQQHHGGHHDVLKPVVIPRPYEQRIRKDRNPRPRAVVVTCPRNKNMVLLGGDERYRMALPTYLDAIRHAKRPTATYMVTALLRRYLPPNTLSRLCVNERQLTNTTGGQMLDRELLEVLKKQGRMQFPQTSIADRELMLRIEDVTRDVRRKIKLKKAMATSTTSKTSRSAGAGSSSTPISMVATNRLGEMGGVSSFSSGGNSNRRSKGFASETINDDGDGRVLRLRDAEMTLADGDEDEDNYDENPQALPMFS